jgi:UDP-glucose 4-epimerase
MNSGILITGAAGFIGAALLRHLQDGLEPLIGLDRRLPPAPPGVSFHQADIRDRAALVKLFTEMKPRVVVHLASVVAAGGDPKLDHAIDVGGTENVLHACQAADVRRLVVTSSGAAYGYHADNPVPLREEDALRGNDAFPYARNKRLVEEMLARWRQDYSILEQVVFRPCTVLGPGVSNQITAIFERSMVTGLAGASTPFSFVAESDVVAALARATKEGPPGIYNLAGDGALTLSQIATRIGKTYLAIPPNVMKAALWLGNTLGLTDLGPAQVLFLQYRPVLDNKRLKTEFGYVPVYSSAAAFDRYWKARPA